MSETQRTRGHRRRSPGARESPYPRENYFASVDDEYDRAREPLDDTRNDHHLRTLDRGTSKDEWIVATLQKGQATMLCPYALNESPDAEWALHDENGEVVLSDPSEYPPPASGFVTPDRHGRPEAVDESVAVQPRPRLSRVRRDSPRSVS